MGEVWPGGAWLDDLGSTVLLSPSELPVGIIVRGGLVERCWGWRPLFVPGIRREFLLLW